MRVSEVHFPGRPPIDGYGPGFFRIGGAVHRGPVVLLPAATLAWAGLPDIEVLLEQSSEFDVLLLGMGPEIRPLAAELRRPLEAAGIGVEIMATASACRTYNVLVSEGRRIAAALMPT